MRIFKNVIITNLIKMAEYIVFIDGEYKVTDGDSEKCIVIGLGGLTIKDIPLFENGILIQTVGLSEYIVKYRSIVLEQEIVHSLQDVCDIINQYHKLTKIDIRKQYIDKLRHIKSELKADIVKLREENIILEDKAFFYNKIGLKFEQIKALFSQEELTENNTITQVI